jgi:5-methylcytosine-specific restriction endonuclease McrA
MWKPNGSIRKNLWPRIVERDGLVCRWCQKVLQRVPRGHEGDLKHFHATMDHVVPRSRGGETTFENIVVACHLCNQRRSNHGKGDAGQITEEQLIQLMR